MSKPLPQALRRGFLAVVEIVQLSGIFGEIVQLRLGRLDVLIIAHAKAAERAASEMVTGIHAFRVDRLFSWLEKTSSLELGRSRDRQ